MIINLEEVQKADGCPLFRGQACNTRRTNGETPTSMFRRTQACMSIAQHHDARTHGYRDLKHDRATLALSIAAAWPSSWEA